MRNSTREQIRGCSEIGVSSHTVLPSVHEERGREKEQYAWRREQIISLGYDIFFQGVKKHYTRYRNFKDWSLVQN